ncbi:hypothetical protein [Clostridium sp. Marseille-P2415]|uniref:hypothetical protein n=1 Tax=Clostridium sp. Marseille-P2415 TaxID=1805471 RepID=UPI000988795C|nr:hypothetical protein [Clostridium sp. Marseille-P2415]
MDYDVVPMEKLLSMEWKGAMLYGEGVSYRCLFVPAAQKYPEALRNWLKAAEESGFPVYQVTSDEMKEGDFFASAITLDKVAGIAKYHGCNDIETADKIPYLRYYHYIHDTENLGIHMFFNESTLHALNTAIELHKNENTHMYVYDPYENRLTERSDWKDGKIFLNLEPAETVYLIESDRRYQSDAMENIVLQEEKGEFEFEISAASYQSPDKTKYIDNTSRLKDFFKWRPDFAGYIYYKTWLGRQEKQCVLNLGKAYEAAEVLVNGKSAGVRRKALSVLLPGCSA